MFPPALSMVNEKPEADLLLRRPRDRKTDRLIKLETPAACVFLSGLDRDSHIHGRVSHSLSSGFH